MNDSKDIPTLTDLIQPGEAITLSDLGLDEEVEAVDESALPGEAADESLNIDLQDAAPVIEPPDYQPFKPDPAVAAAAFASANTEPATSEDSDYPAEISPVLEQTIRRILDEHMELALQEIRIAIQHYLDRK